MFLELCFRDTCVFSKDLTRGISIFSASLRESLNWQGLAVRRKNSRHEREILEISCREF